MHSAWECWFLSGKVKSAGSMCMAGGWVGGAGWGIENTVPTVPVPCTLSIDAAEHCCCVNKKNNCCINDAPFMFNGCAIPFKPPLFANSAHGAWKSAFGCCCCCCCDTLPPCGHAHTAPHVAVLCRRDGTHSLGCATSATVKAHPRALLLKD